MGTKQGSIAGFFTKKPTPTKAKIVDTKPGISSKRTQGADVIIDLTETEDLAGQGEAVKPEHDVGKREEGSTSASPRKRRKLSPNLDEKPPHEFEIKAAPKSEPRADHLTINPSEEFTYPPTTHPSYAQPPSPTHNHPFPIPPPTSTLLSSLSFNPNPRSILKPKLDLDLLYFNQFISGGSKGLYEYLLDSLPWYRVRYVTKGITINTPRWTTVFGKDCSSREWGGYAVKPRAIPEILLRLMEIGTSLNLA
jgi:hypothetical protein